MARALTRRQLLRGALGTAGARLPEGCASTASRPRRNEVWASYADPPFLANLLLKQGFSPEEASKLMGGNYVRIFDKAVHGGKP